MVLLKQFSKIVKIFHWNSFVTYCLNELLSWMNCIFRMGKSFRFGSFVKYFHSHSVALFASAISNPHIICHHCLSRMRFFYGTIAAFISSICISFYLHAHWRIVHFLRLFLDGKLKCEKRKEKYHSISFSSFILNPFFDWFQSSTIFSCFRLWMPVFAMKTIHWMSYEFIKFISLLTANTSFRWTFMSCN